MSKYQVYKCYFFFPSVQADLLDIRLVDNTTSLAGKLEMLYDEEWIAMCSNSIDYDNDDVWNNQAAWVACR